MDILTLSPVILIIIAVIVFILTKKILQAIGIALLVFVLLLFVFGIFAYKDYEDLKSRFMSEEKLFLFMDEGKYTAGFTASDMDISSESEVVFLDDALIQEYNSKTKKDILGNGYRIIIFEEPAFDETEYVSIGEISLSKDNALQVIKSENPISEISSLAGVGEGYITENYGIRDNSQARSAVFSAIVASSLKEDMVFVVKGIKEKSIEVYPNTAIFQIVKFIPSSVFEKIINGMDIKDKVMN